MRCLVLLENGKGAMCCGTGMCKKLYNIMKKMTRAKGDGCFDSMEEPPCESRWQMMIFAFW